MVAKKGAKKSAGSAKKTTATKTASAKVKKIVKEQTKEGVVVKKEKVAEKKVAKKVEIATKKDTKVQGKSKKVQKVSSKKGEVVRATGKRKTSVAKVACFVKNGEKVSILVNELDYKKYFTKLLNQDVVYSPFALLGINTGYVVEAEVNGGGKTGQADAIKLGLSRCLALLSEEYSKILRKNNFLTRDARRVEPKKYGLKKARKKEQFSKR